MLVTKTPDNIDSLSFNEVASLIPVEPDSKLPKPINRMKLIRLIFQVLNYDLSTDLAMALCAEPTAKLIIATAGGGKTTGAQIGAIFQKIWRPSRRDPKKKITGDKILCLVYNRHNVKPMEEKHKMLVNRLRMSSFSDLDIDDEIFAATMHSFCDQIRKENVAKMKLIGFHLQKDSEAEAVMRTVKTKILTKHGIRSNPLISDLLALYNYAKESMLEVKQLEETDKFQDLHLDIEVISEIFAYYDKLKALKRKYDYVDLLTMVYELLRTDEEALRKTQLYFEYIIADEIQDFTPIMMNILQLLVSNGTPLLCIGDEDQGIYNFRGADIYNTLDFEQKFPGGEVYSLIRNRRCRKEILDFAKEVISENKIRYHKIITGVKDGGNVEMIPYNSVESEHLKLISLIKQLPESTLDDSVICYRDRVSSIMLTEQLAEEGIPFHVISGYAAYSHPLYKDLLEIFNALESPYDAILSISLYKVLPIKRDKIYSIFGYDAATKRFKEHNKQHFANYDYGDAMAINGFAETMDTLKRLSNIIHTTTMDNIFPIIFKFLCRYHWNFLRRDRENLSIYDDYMEMRVDKVFNQHKTYQNIFASLSSKMERCRINNQTKSGIAISTFHGLKGLEYKNCYLIDLDNNKFPNFAFIDKRPYSEHVKNALKECETRLFYVAVTRAKDNLYMFYNEDNPSRYLLSKVKPSKIQQFIDDEDRPSSMFDFLPEVIATQQTNSADSFEETNKLIEEDDSLLDLLDDSVENIVEEPKDDSLLDLLDDSLSIMKESSKITQDNSLQLMDIDAVPISTKSSNSGSFLNNIIKGLGG